ncbi:class 1b ribonucleoside-diphosphate reductase subunit alpha [Staphylococcus pasteuri]|uniref:class 1b ribonucleoside-diphosphate reductase subunit alpha n=1 Tax=Staphylococcus pasteuri TaxID=45972 RepID=UPI000F84CA6B|nr:class 1b ribonucleoside-diphosphate reductase subunit alpha [Staphylococcus pasteuri]MCE3020907.1 class 1b ribonucleoside-diphosphate reductase subunit alpha [Staphylococcus pasteuri]MEB6612174.1 class 1b ribonucleoside-diphosphate reductase subunit alpha [Staphylococcus pasteuri]QDW85205.1 class 1b ribonucleoside-diphosphate reductase subunit alpha [Staphylococcus pasteuri]QQN53703.1 class 1b ribonucleoside-diphosphate reductase subunit alpha [Staphylococcus pasteuri]RTX75105.1 class 1b ri
MKTMDEKKYNHIELNNEVTKRKDNGFFNLEKDQEALKVYLEEIHDKTIYFDSEIERLHYLVDNNFYFNVFEKYSEADLIEITEYAKSINFQFASYMSASKFYKDYALKTNDKQQFLEDYNQHVAIVSMYLANGDKNQAKQFISSMVEQRYQPATPTFLNAGRARRGELVSCFLLEVDDSLNSINFIDSTAKQLSKIGGGVAINLSKLRARGEAIKGIKGVAKGVLPVAKSLEGGFSYADQLGQRPGAGAVYLNIFHYDVEEFLDTKKVNADEDLRLSTISTGLIVPSKFFDLAKEGKDFYMFAPHTVKQEYGVTLDDIDLDKYYDDMVANPNVEKKKKDAREMLNTIAQTQLQSGYPYLMFKDNANKVHANSNIGQIKMSNLCTEIFQLQETSVINDYGTEDDIKRDISCNLGSLNIVNVMESGKFRDSVHTGMDALTVVSDEANIQNAPGVKKANSELHSVGLGVMNLHGYLAKNKIGYESEEAKDFANIFFMMMNYYSIERSMQIAKERGEKYLDFEKSDYANGKYFEFYTSQEFEPQFEKVRELFEGLDIPTAEDWKALQKDVEQYGLYHAYRLAIAPTQSISYVQNATSSVMPIVDQIERRTYGNAETFYPMPFLSPETMWYYKSAFNTDQMKLIDLVSTIQTHVDQGISTILYVNSEISTRELSRLYVYAHHKGLKSLYYTRNKLLSVEECTSCAI